MLVFVTVLLSVCLSPTAQLKMLDKTQEPFFDVTANSVFTGIKHTSAFVNRGGGQKYLLTTPVLQTNIKVYCRF